MISGAITTIVFSLILILWTFLSGKSFTWIPIEPLDAPSLFNFSFYSAFTYLSSGFVLYHTFFYWALKKICVDLLGDWKLYYSLKSIIWLILSYLSYKYLLPFIIDTVNSICSFFFNIFHLVLYLSPSLGITIVLVVLYKFYKSNIRLYKTL